MSEFSPTNQLRAENNPKFYARFKWLGLAMFAFCGWFLYDGMVTWPLQRDRSQALIALAEETFTEEQVEEVGPVTGHHAQEAFDKLRRVAAEHEPTFTKWEEVAAEEGWSEELPEKVRTDDDIFMQFVMAIPCAIAGAWMLLTVVLSNGRWIELRDGAIHTSWGQTFPLSSVTQIDKRQWRDKGIARVKYNHEGKAGKFVVDDYKFHRKTTDQILLEIEQSVGEDKITGGPPEKTPEQLAAEEAASDDAAGEPANEAEVS